MCEITRTNFDEYFPKIKEIFSNCTFLSIDCEFSSLCSNDDLQNSLFDTPAQRYFKTRESIKQMVPLQIGITAFTYLRDENIYQAKPFNFYTLPASFSSIDKSFICTASSFSFLRDFDFDFNKFAHEGIPYISEEQEVQILSSQKNGTLFTNTKYGLQNKSRDDIQEYISHVSKWFYIQKGENEIVLFDTTKKNVDFLYVMHMEIQSLFCMENLAAWTYIENNKFKVKKVKRSEYDALKAGITLEDDMIEYYLGFTKVYRLLKELKKPIVGHNLLLDIMLIINTFQEELPTRYTKFKKLCVEMFPLIFDTKFISFEMRESLTEETKWKSNGLQELYGYFRNEKGRHLVKNSPRIEIDKEFSVKTDCFHDAGWDSYSTGYCFIRMAHYFAAKNYTESSRAIMSSEHFKVIDKFKNHVNIIRATVSHVVLDGPDPVSRRPPCLIIKSTKKNKIDIFKVTELLSEYGSVEIKPFADKGKTAIAAVANFSSARRILSRFHNHNDFRIMQYNALKHSPIFRAALWGGVVLSGTALAVLLINYKITK